MMNRLRKRPVILLTVGLVISISWSLDSLGIAGTERANSSSANPQDWSHFDPHKFHPAERLVPAPAVIPDKAGYYANGVPSFPHDPTRATVVLGRGETSLPTEIYSKAFDILQIQNKYFQVPAAGESKPILVDGKTIVLYGTSCYTPMPVNPYSGNPVQVSPFDPSRIFYKDKDMWPAVIYGQPGQEITIAGQKVRIPAAGQNLVVIFGKDGRLKTEQSNTQSAESLANNEGTAASKAEGKSAANGTSTVNRLSSTSSKDSTASAAVQKATAEKAAAEKAAAEKAAAEKAAAEKAAAEKAAAEKAAAEKAAAEKAAAEKAAAEKAAAEKAAAQMKSSFGAGTSLDNTVGKGTAVGTVGAGTAVSTVGTGTAVGTVGTGTAVGTVGTGTAVGTVGTGTAVGTVGTGTAVGTVGTGTAVGTVGAGTAVGTVGTGTAAGTTGSATSGDGGTGSGGTNANSTGAGGGAVFGATGGGTGTGETTEAQLRSSFELNASEQHKLTPDEIKNNTSTILFSDAGFDWQRPNQVLKGVRECIFSHPDAKRLSRLEVTLPVDMFFPNALVNPWTKFDINTVTPQISSPQLINVKGRFQASDFEPTGNFIGEVTQKVTFYTTQATKVDNPNQGDYIWPIDKTSDGKLIDVSWGKASVEMKPNLVTVVAAVPSHSGTNPPEKKTPQLDSGF